jgi:hypothetical protein
MLKISDALDMKLIVVQFIEKWERADIWFFMNTRIDCYFANGGCRN